MGVRHGLLALVLQAGAGFPAQIAPPPAMAPAAQEEALAIAPEGGTLRPDLQETLRRMRILLDLRTKPRPGKAR